MLAYFSVRINSNFTTSWSVLVTHTHIIILFSDPKNEVPKEEPSEKPTLHLKYRPINAYQPYLAPAHPTQLYFSSIHPGKVLLNKYQE